MSMASNDVCNHYYKMLENIEFEESAHQSHQQLELVQPSESNQTLSRAGQLSPSHQLLPPHQQSESNLSPAH